MVKLVNTADLKSAAEGIVGSSPSSSICIKCNLTLPIEEFSFKNKGLNKRHKQCKKCKSQYSSKHYLENKDSYKKKARLSNKALINRNIQFINELKAVTPCMDCKNIYNPVVMDFDHLHAKTANVSRLVHSSLSLESIREEITKCELVCANCHRIRTYERKRLLVQWDKMLEG